VFVTVSAIASIASQLAIPLIVAAAIDGPIKDGNAAGLWPLFALTVVLAIFDLGLTYRRRLYLAHVSTDVETRIRDDFYEHLQRLEVGFHDRWQSGQLLSRSSSDIALIRRFASFGAIFLLVIVVEVLGIFALLLHLYPPLALLTMATAIPVLVLCRRFERDYHAVVRRIQDQSGDLTTAIEENARGIRVIKAFGRSQEMFARYDAQCRELRDTQLERVAVHTRFIWVLVLIPNLTLAAVLLAGAVAVAHGGMSIGDLVAFISYVLILVWPIEELGWILAMAEEAETAAGRVWEVFDTEPVIADRPYAHPLKHARGEVRFDAVEFVYPGADRTVLRGVDLEINPGETLALVGATGAGKTTVATLLARLYDPTAGAVRLDGHDLRDLSLRTLRQHVGFAFEEPTLFSAACENLLIGTPTRRTPISMPRSRSRRRRSRTTCRGVSTRASASRGSRSPVVNVSASPWRAPSSAARACSSSMTRFRRWTSTPKRSWSARCGRSSRIALRSWSCTDLRRSRSQTAPRSSTAA
jgi:ATP-binding cassette subfamily B protein